MTSTDVTHVRSQDLKEGSFGTRAWEKQVTTGSTLRSKRLRGTLPSCQRSRKKV